MEELIRNMWIESEVAGEKKFTGRGGKEKSKDYNGSSGGLPKKSRGGGPASSIGRRQIKEMYHVAGQTARSELCKEV